MCRTCRLCHTLPKGPHSVVSHTFPHTVSVSFFVGPPEKKSIMMITNRIFSVILATMLSKQAGNISVLFCTTICRIFTSRSSRPSSLHRFLHSFHFYFRTRLECCSRSQCRFVCFLIHHRVLRNLDVVFFFFYHRYFSYFTTLTYIGLCAYFFALGVQTLVYACGNRRGYPLQRWPKFLQFLHVLLHATIVTYRASTCLLVNQRSINRRNPSSSPRHHRLLGITRRQGHLPDEIFW
jgi:hypothetical protein